MWSWPWVLLMSKARMIFRIYWSSKSITKIVASHKHFVSIGVELSFSIENLEIQRENLDLLSWKFRPSIMEISTVHHENLKHLI